MILETGRVLAVEPKGLWVETLQGSACGSCRAQKGCGQRLLANLGGNASHLWVLLDGRDAAHYCVGDEVQVGIPEDVITRGAFLVYMLPLAAMLVAVIFAHSRSMGDAATAACALVGLLLGAAIVRLRSWQIRFDTRLQPVLVDGQTMARVIQLCEVG